MNIRSRKSKSHVEVATHSMNDIMFFLMLFFLIMASFVTQSGLKVDLPKSKSKLASNAKNSVTIDAQANYSWNDEVVKKEDIQQKLKTILVDERDEKNTTITLRCDREVKMEEAAYVISLIAEYKGSVVIATKKK